MRQTTKRIEKRALLEAYFAAVAKETVAPAARYFSGLFVPDSPTFRIEWADVVDAMRDLVRIDLAGSAVRYMEYGDLADAAAEAFAGRLPSGISVKEVSVWGEQLARATEPGAPRDLLRDMLARLSAMEARYLVKLVGGELRIGVDEAQVEQAVARARRRAIA